MGFFGKTVLSIRGRAIVQLSWGTGMKEPGKRDSLSPVTWGGEDRPSKSGYTHVMDACGGRLWVACQVDKFFQVRPPAV